MDLQDPMASIRGREKRGGDVWGGPSSLSRFRSLYEVHPNIPDYQLTVAGLGPLHLCTPAGTNKNGRIVGHSIRHLMYGYTYTCMQTLDDQRVIYSACRWEPSVVNYCNLPHLRVRGEITVITHRGNRQVGAKGPRITPRQIYFSGTCLARCSCRRSLG